MEASLLLDKNYVSAKYYTVFKDSNKSIKNINQNVKPPMYVNVEKLKNSGFIFLINMQASCNKTKNPTIFSFTFHPIKSCEEVHNLTF